MFTNKHLCLKPLLIAIVFYCLIPPTTAQGQNSSSKYRTVNEADFLALVALYNATNGSNWTDNDNWLTGPVSSWSGVTLSSNARVVELNLNRNNLTGSIPPEIGDLSELFKLSLGFNSLTDFIPPEIENLSKLWLLYFRRNQLSGEIPPELGNLPKIEHLTLSENNLTGPIPVELANIPRLLQLDLTGNQLTGPIPVELTDNRLIQRIQLGGNQLSGPIPSGLFSLLNLEYLVLGGNQLTGPIPSVEGSILHRLLYLDLGPNNLTGEIPVTIAEFPKLRRLGLGGNQLTGEIPLELFNLSDLEELRLWGNQLIGFIPSELSELTRLEILDLSRNKLKGTIPLELIELTRLNGLNLSYNQLTGTIPFELATRLTSISQGYFCNLEDNEASLCIPDSSEYQALGLNPICELWLRSDCLVSSNLENEIHNDQFGFQIYPNPVSRNFRIRLNQNKETEINIFNTLGRLVQSSQHAAGGTEKIVSVNTAKFPPGNYLVELLFESGKRVSKTITIL